jgi:hypothetical protein
MMPTGSGIFKPPIVVPSRQRARRWAGSCFIAPAFCGLISRKAAKDVDKYSVVAFRGWMLAKDVIG